MRKLLGVSPAMLDVCLLADCWTTKLAQTQIVHDSFFRCDTVQSVRLGKDSVSEREKTTIQAKHDTVNGTDTVFVIREGLQTVGRCGQTLCKGRLHKDSTRQYIYIYIKQPVQNNSPLNVMLRHPRN